MDRIITAEVEETKLQDDPAYEQLRNKQTNNSSGY